MAVTNQGMGDLPLRPYDYRNYYQRDEANEPKSDRNIPAYLCIPLPHIASQSGIIPCWFALKASCAFHRSPPFSLVSSANR